MSILGASVMEAKDSISGALATCYLTIGDERYNFMNAINLEANFDKNKTEVPILGKPGRGNKAAGWTGTGSATFHYNTTIFREMMEKYAHTGVDTYFDMEIYNSDPTSDTGGQSIVLVDCNIDGGIMAKFDADADYLDEDMDFTFEDFYIAEKFDNLPGFVE